MTGPEADCGDAVDGSEFGLTSPSNGPATKPASVIGAVPDLLIMRDAKPGWLLLGL